MASEEVPYEPKNAVKATLNTSLLTGAAGLAMSAVQNTISRENIGAFGIFRRTGATIGSFSL
jgi:hypothetical protein